jgi:hypothetical protein
MRDPAVEPITIAHVERSGGKHNPLIGDDRSNTSGGQCRRGDALAARFLACRHSISRNAAASPMHPCEPVLCDGHEGPSQQQLQPAPRRTP